MRTPRCCTARLLLLLLLPPPLLPLQLVPATASRASTGGQRVRAQVLDGEGGVQGAALVEHPLVELEPAAAQRSGRAGQGAKSPSKAPDSLKKTTGPFRSTGLGEEI